HSVAKLGEHASRHFSLLIRNDALKLTISVPSTTAGEAPLELSFRMPPPGLPIQPPEHVARGLTNPVTIHPILLGRGKEQTAEEAHRTLRDDDINLLTLWADGKSDDEIAKILGRSPSGLNTDGNILYFKLGIEPDPNLPKERARAVKLAVRAGWIPRRRPLQP